MRMTSPRAGLFTVGETKQALFLLKCVRSPHLSLDMGQV